MRGILPLIFFLLPLPAQAEFTDQETKSVRALIRTHAFLLEGVRGYVSKGDSRNAVVVARAAHEFVSSFVILLGGDITNRAVPLELQAWSRLPRSKQVDVAKEFVRRLEQNISSLSQPHDPQVVNAEDEVRHNFDKKLSYSSPFLFDVAIPTAVAQHGDLRAFYNREFFASKYWTEEFTEGRITTERAAHYIEGIKAIFRSFVLVANLDQEPRDAFCRVLHATKLLCRDVPQHYLFFSPSRDRDSWFHSGLGWCELMRFPNSSRCSEIQWDRVE